ncbi:MAG: deoxyribose-phosphate aldolase [Prevotellaceae bacterium]|jgi:deoxyribose-phosphate aldolase|nr:deoxyribose-phosphate aldolase [Prevotellaceae bacterium]
MYSSSIEFKDFKDLEEEVNPHDIQSRLSGVTAAAGSLHTAEVYRQCLSCVDYTSLNATDTQAHGKLLAERVNRFAASYPDLPNVAAICVYPSLVKIVRETLKAEGVQVASVGAGFPAAQTFLRVKLEECKMAVEVGASEVDVVISLGYFLGDNAQAAFEEVRQVREALGSRCHLKVILETGLLPSLSLVRKASLGCMAAGADFIKTSTGKITPAATPEAALTMCLAIMDCYRKTGKKVGFKAAGGITTSAEAVLYYAIVKEILGAEWLAPSLFRIGASRLANNLLSDITGRKETFF